MVEEKTVDLSAFTVGQQRQLLALATAFVDQIAAALRSSEQTPGRRRPIVEDGERLVALDAYEW